ncbi:glycosyltransferase, partial [Streptomyces lasiicapitis]|uniref:glycosyltransferase n=1 Tax=Streptomyces lasiicapitis TaxID=1923961 RepID=UPI00367B168E
MRILIAAAGSYGDIAPYTGLGARLRTAGHDVAIATHDGFAPLVRGAGLALGPRPPDAGAPGPGAGGRALLGSASALVLG